MNGESEDGEAKRVVDGSRSMRAVKGTLDRSLSRMFGAAEGMEPVDLLCSRNAHDRNVLVRRAQWEINQPPSLRDNEQA